MDGAVPAGVVLAVGFVQPARAVSGLGAVLWGLQLKGRLAAVVLSTFA